MECLRFGFRPVRAVRLRAAPGALDAPRAADRQRRDVGPRRGGARRSARGGGPRLRAQPGRRRVLRPEDRPAHDRLAGSLLAARNGAARLLDARALRPRVHGRRQRRAPAGDDPPRAARLLRALHRHPDRALRRRAAAVAGAGAGDRAARLRPLQPLRRATVQARAARSRPARASWTIAASRSGARSATRSCARFPTCWSWASARQQESTVSVRERTAGGATRRAGWRAPRSRRWRSASQRRPASVSGPRPDEPRADRAERGRGGYRQHPHRRPES